MNNIVKGMADRDEIVSLLSDLVAIDSINPDYPGGTLGEGKVVEYVARYLDLNGIEYRLDEVLPGRHNLIAKLPGKTRSGICFEAHTDTVTIEGMQIKPFSPDIRDGLLYGRGSCDTKGSLVCMMYALSMLKKNNIVPSTDIYLAAAVDEEFRYRGVTHLIESGFRVHSAVIGEPTSLHVVTACKGVIRFRVHAAGKAGHSARPHEGHNAIYDMASVIHEIEENLIPAFDSRVHPMLGKPTINVGVVSGGILVNIIPDKCTIEIDRRTLPGENYDTVAAEISEIITRLMQKNSSLRAVIDPPMLTDYAMDTPTDSEIVRTANEASGLITGSYINEGVSYCCDATKFSRASMPSIVLGPGNILQAHTAVEFIDISELAPAAEIYAQICLGFKA